MLLVHPNSRCDVCLEAYSGQNSTTPHVIQCGHTFCVKCLWQLTQPICPLCRSSFAQGDTRRVLVDVAPRSPTREKTLSVFLEDKSGPIIEEDDEDGNAEALYYQDRISQLILRSSHSLSLIASSSRRDNEAASLFLRHQPSNNHVSLRALLILLSQSFALQNKCHDLEHNLQTLRRQSDLHREAALETEKKYSKVYRQYSEERDQRSQSEHESSKWKRKCDDLISECQKLKDEVDRLRQTDSDESPVRTPPRPPEDPFRHRGVYGRGSKTPPPMPVSKQTSPESRRHLSSKKSLDSTNGSKLGPTYFVPPPSADPVPLPPKSSFSPVDRDHSLSENLEELYDLLESPQYIRSRSNTISTETAPTVPSRKGTRRMTAPSQTPPAPIASRAATPTPSHRSYGHPPTTPPLPELSSNYSSSRSSTTSPTRSNNPHQSHFPIMQTQTGSKSSTSLRLTPDSHAHRSHPTSPSALERLFWHPPKLGFMRSGQDSDH